MKKLTILTLAAVVLALPALATGDKAETTFDTLMSHYETVRVALLNDTTKDITKHALEIARLAEDAATSFRPATAGIDASKEDECVALLPKISTEARALAAASDLESARDAFFALSKSFIRLKGMSSGDDDPTTYYCPMAKRSWLQQADEIGNPYYGQKMAKCGKKIEN